MLWKKVMPRLSAGRVQSVATRLIVDRERERIAFRSASYWDLEAEFATEEHGRERLPSSPTSSLPRSLTVDGTRVAQGRDFTPQGELRGTDMPAPGRRGRGRARRSGCATTPPASGLFGGAKAVPAFAVRAVPHDDAAAGGVAQARLLRQVHDVRGPAAVRERPHHLYADRLDPRCRRRRSPPPASRRGSSTAPSTCRTRRASTRAR